MLGDLLQIKGKGQGEVRGSQGVFDGWMNPSTGRRSRSVSNAGDCTKNVNKREINAINLFMPFLEDLADNRIQEDFQQKFLFGVEMQIWRKGNIKPVSVFMDQNLQSLLWISTKTKAFLVDLTYATLSRFDYELEKASKVKDYIILRYFGQQIPLLFRGEARNEVAMYCQLFERYIFWNKATNDYPPYFSRIMKLYTMEEVKDNISRKKTAGDLLKVSELIGVGQDQQYCRRILSLLSPGFTESSALTNIQISDYFKILHCPDSLLVVFNKYCSRPVKNESQFLEVWMHKDEFGQFLRRQQQQDENRINFVLRQTKEKISFYDFCAYLESQKENYAAEAPPLDETLPIHQYYVYSSHNTYLTGNQLTSDSKVQRYLQDLLGGLKCVELDVHNDGQTPIITHAVNDRSLCKPIDFEETIKQITRFCNQRQNHYPLILSIENHAKEENRYKMFNILTKHLQHRLFFPSDPNQAKSLGQLRGRVIVKTDSFIRQITTYNRKPLPPPAPLLPLPPTLQPKIPDTQFGRRQKAFQEWAQEQEKRKKVFSEGLPKVQFLPFSQMTKITGMFKSPQGVDNNESGPFQCTSLTNEKAVKSHEEKILAYTRRSWLRIYPLASQIGSSNYNPLPLLRLGAQIIALNTQTKDDNAWLMMSYFTAGRQTNSANMGYVEKPPHLRGIGLAPSKLPKSYHVRVLSTDHKVRIRYMGSESDTRSNLGEPPFRVVDYLEGFIMFDIDDKLRDCIPLRFIRTGYRVIVAKNELYLDSGVRIIIHVTIQ